MDIFRTLLIISKINMKFLPKTNIIYKFNKIEIGQVVPSSVQSAH